jgi:hypothetical protein
MRTARDTTISARSALALELFVMLHAAIPMLELLHA